jgi:hypothetical protein
VGIRVTRAFTIQGRYYGLGEVVDESPAHHSYRRLYGWELVPDTPSEPAPPAGTADNLVGMKKADLQALAADRGLEPPPDATRKNLIDLLES